MPFPRYMTSKEILLKLSKILPLSYLNAERVRASKAPSRSKPAESIEVNKPNPTEIQSKQDELTLKLTQSMVVFGNPTKSNSRSESWIIVLNRTLEFRTLDFCKTGVENQCNKCLEAQLFRYNTACFS